VAELALGRDPIADRLLELLGLGKAALGATVEDLFARHPDFEGARRLANRHQRDLAELTTIEGREQLLGQPSRAQQPATARAVANLDSRLVHSRSIAEIAVLRGSETVRDEPETWQAQIHADRPAARGFDLARALQSIEAEDTMQIRALFDHATYTLTYLVWDPQTKDAVVIDPVLDYDPLASQIGDTSVDQLAAIIDGEQLKLRFVLETHAHADHLSSSQVLRQRYDAPVAIGKRITEVQQTFKPVFDLGEGFATDGSQFDRLLDDGETLAAGSLAVQVIATPGHTPACVSFLIGDALFTGDALFMDDYGTGRCDFPRGSAAALYESIHSKLYALPDATRVFVGHDYQPGGREVRWETSIGRSKAANPQLRAETSAAEFIEFREARDRTLAPPRLIFQSVQVNVDAGRLPEAHANGRRYLKLPIDLFKK